MTFVAEAALTIDALPEQAFDKLADYASWRAWMPRSFRPTGGARGPLRAGDRMFARIAGSPVPTPLRVSVADRGRELTWTGGVRAVLHAEHRFLFEPAGDGRTRVRSVETWSGAAAAAMRRWIQPSAERIGGQQLAGLASTFAAKR